MRILRPILFGLVLLAIAEIATPAHAWSSEALSDIRSSSAAPGQVGASVGAPDPEQQKVMEQARDLIMAKDYVRAIDLLLSFLKDPRNASVPAARELLGVAYERKGEFANAKEAYTQYLHDYPSDPGIARVQQRLATLAAEQSHPMAEGLRTGTSTGVDAGAQGVEPRWDTSASLSAYYYHDELSTTSRDSLKQIAYDNGTTSLVSQFVTTLDASVGVTTQDFRGKFLVAGSYTKDFTTGFRDRLRVAELYVEGSDASGIVSAKIGRQFRSSGGVMGRIDGGVVSVRLDDQFKFDFVGGFPVDSTYTSFGTSRYAYGVTLDYAEGPFSAALYTLQQNDSGFVDRQSIGAEARYLDGTASAYGTIDYDLHFDQINLALVNANYVFEDQTSINIAADYRRAPLLRISDALIGQRFWLWAICCRLILGQK